MESFSDCARRDIVEKCGIEIEDIKLHFVSNTDNYKPKHYVHIGFIVKWKSGVPEVLESGGIDDWEWRSRNDIPMELSVGAALTLKALEKEA